MLGFRTRLNEDFKGRETSMSRVKEEIQMSLHWLETNQEVQEWQRVERALKIGEERRQGEEIHLRGQHRSSVYLRIWHSG